MAFERMCKSRKGYISMLHVLVERRKNIKKGAYESDEKFRKRRKRMTDKIGRCRAALRRYDRIFKKMDAVNSVIKVLFNHSVRHGGFTANYLKNNKNKKLQLAKKCFYKYCLENGISGFYIIDYVGVKNKDTPRISRKIFTVSFKINKENRETYHRFLKEINQLNKN